MDPDHDDIEPAAPQSDMAARLAALIRHMRTGTIVEDERRRIALTNQAFCDLFGIAAPPEAMVGADCAAAAEALKGLFLDPDAFIARTTAALAGGIPVIDEELALVDGRILQRDYAPVRTDGVLRGHLWSYRDVTAARRAAAENVRLRRFYEQVLDGLPAQVAVFDRECRFLYVNAGSIADPEVRRWVIGRTNEDYCRHRGVPVAIGEERSREIRHVFETGEVRYFEESFERNGVVRTIGRFVAPVRDADEQVLQVVGFGHDLTDLKRTEGALAASEARLRATMEAALDCVITIDRAGRILDFNPAAERTFGFTRAELMGREMAESIVPERLRVRHRQGMRHYLETGEGPVLRRRIEVPAIRADGTEFPVELTITPLELPDGQQLFTAFVRDITDRQRAEAALAEGEERLRLAVEVAQLGTYDTDMTTGVSTVNDRYLRMFGLAPGEIETTLANLTKLIHPEDAPRVAATFAAHARGETDVFEAEYRMRHRSGAWVWIHDRARVIARDDAARPLRTCGTHLDISARKEAEQATLVREQLLANTSHELRTPLNVIVGLAHLLEHGSLDTEAARSVQGIRFAADTLLALINDLLDLSRIRSGAVHFESVAFEIRPLLESITRSLEAAAQRHDLALTLELAPEVPTAVVGDPMRLSQVLFNLVSNAIKFTERGGVALRVTTAVLDNDTPALAFSVADTGVGVATEDQHRIFEAFQQVNAATTREFGGTGLGLAIVSELVRQQGGRIDLESSMGAGSIFRVTLPLAAAEGEVPNSAEAQDAAPVADLHGYRLLLVEDHELNRLVARRILERAGAEVTAVASGREALDRLRVESFDLVLMDIQMPQMDGHEATWRIRNELHLSERTLPIVALTATTMTPEARRAVATGMSGYVLKPFRPEVLTQRIAELLAAGRRDAGPGHIDRTVLADVTMGQEDFAREVLTVFTRTVPPELARLAAAGEQGDGATIGRIAHALKSQAGTIGATALQRTMEALERDARTAGAAIDPAAVRAAVRLGQAVVAEAARLAIRVSAPTG